jgi:glycosyltransferase involved in cell wall biosynthesis
LLLGTNRRIVGNASAVVANSESLRRLALASFPQQRIDVVTNGVCPRSFRPPRSRPARNTVRALCVARLIDRKGLESMLRGLALTRHESLELDFVGLGPRLDYLKGLADTLGVANRVRFRGHLAGAELADAYRDADIFLLTSLSESFSMALLEGMASGLPVVATRIGGIPELVTEGENGLLVPPNDPRSLAEKLDILAASPERRARIGANNRRKIEASYGWSAIAKQYMDRFYSPSCQGA